MKNKRIFVSPLLLSFKSQQKVKTVFIDTSKRLFTLISPRDWHFASQNSRITCENQCHPLIPHSPCRTKEHKMRRWMTYEQVAKEIQIPLKSLYLYHYRGEGPKTSRFGRHLRVLEADLITWQEERANIKTL